MKKFISALMILTLISALCSCGNTASSSSVQPMKSLPTSTSQSGIISSSVLLDNEDENYTPKLTAGFYEQVGYFINLAGDVDVNNLRLDPDFFSNLWHFVYFDAFAAQDGHPTKFDLGQYKSDEDIYSAIYKIPSSAYKAAMESWYGNTFDIGTLPIMTESTLTGIPDRPCVGYDPDGDVVYVIITGVGDPSFFHVGEIEITNADRLVTATIHTLTNKDEDGNVANEYTIPTGYITIQLTENEDDTYTIVGYERVYL